MWSKQRRKERTEKRKFVIPIWLVRELFHSIFFVFSGCRFSYSSKCFHFAELSRRIPKRMRDIEIKPLKKRKQLVVYIKDNWWYLNNFQVVYATSALSGRETFISGKQFICHRLQNRSLTHRCNVTFCCFFLIRKDRLLLLTRQERTRIISK